MTSSVILALMLAQVPSPPTGLVATPVYDKCVCIVAAKPNTNTPDSVVSCVGEVGPIVWHVKNEIGWHDGEACESMAWDVIRGIIGDWPVSRGTCLVDESWKCWWAASDPLPDVGFWFLVRGHNVCGTGSWGFQANSDGSGVERTNVYCPMP